MILSVPNYPVMAVCSPQPPRRMLAQTISPPCSKGTSNISPPTLLARHSKDDMLKHNPRDMAHRTGSITIGSNWANT